MRTKLLLTMILSFLLMSCQKEIPPPPNQCSCTCHCGTIYDKYISNNGFCVDVRNDCSNNFRTFYLSVDEWTVLDVGDRTCFTYINYW